MASWQKGRRMELYEAWRYCGARVEVPVQDQPTLLAAAELRQTVDRYRARPDDAGFLARQAEVLLRRLRVAQTVNIRCPFSGNVEIQETHEESLWSCPLCGTLHEKQPDEDPGRKEDER